MTRQQFEREIDEFERRLSDAQCPLPDENAGEDEVGSAFEYHAGVEAFRAGLALLRAFLTSGSRASLADGTRQIWEAHSRVRAAGLACAGA